MRKNRVESVRKKTKKNHEKRRVRCAFRHIFCVCCYYNILGRCPKHLYELLSCAHIVQLCIYTIYNTARGIYPWYLDTNRSDILLNFHSF